MSAQPTPPFPASCPATEARLERCSVLHLDTVMAVEQRAYAHPWTRGNFQDASVRPAQGALQKHDCSALPASAGRSGASCARSALSTSGRRS